ncbi:hypothetical protein MPL1032_180010 [Mesorhizobium plurifarium]|uniref:Uncharacterized protein n=1 Tax=Mesorhizobium plurifarium TaxID=69974 RepID=A0A0K2VU20_MESPL|nr:hypothetical protein MPL1032_180010 [Mesorhizobium plurifarium]
MREMEKNMNRYIVAFRLLHREDEGESRIDGRPLSSSYFEELSFSVEGDATVSAIFDKINRRTSDRVVDVRLFDDLSNYRSPRPTEPDF